MFKMSLIHVESFIDSNVSRQHYYHHHSDLDYELVIKHNSIIFILKSDNYEDTIILCYNDPVTSSE